MNQRGRPPKGNDKLPKVPAHLPRDLIALIDEARKNESRSAYIRNLVEKQMRGYLFLTKRPWSLVYCYSLPVHPVEFIRRIDPNGPLSNDPLDWQEVGFGDRVLPQGLYRPWYRIHSDNIIKIEEESRVQILPTHHAHWMEVEETSDVLFKGKVLVDRDVLYCLRGGTREELGVILYDLVRLDSKNIRDYPDFVEGMKLCFKDDRSVWEVQKRERGLDDKGEFFSFECTKLP